MKPTRNNRRDFLKAVGSAATTFTILQAGSARTYAANEKLNIASVGAGGQAGGDIRSVDSQNIVALCDVDWERAAGSFDRYPSAKRFTDYRVMLPEMESKIDAVIVATPDHHHFHASMAAIRLGKHVYCEKPLTHSIWEARELTEAARKAGVATQMGNQAQASENTRLIQEFVISKAVARHISGRIDRREVCSTSTGRKESTAPATLHRFRKRSRGMSGSDPLQRVRTTRLTCQPSGAAGGTLERALWVISPVITSIQSYAR